MWILLPIIVFSVMIWMATQEKRERKEKFPKEWMDPDPIKRKTTNFLPYYLLAILFIGLLCSG